MRTLKTPTNLNGAFSKLHAFINYNYQVILPGDPDDDDLQWQRVFRRDYRIAYVLIAGVLAGFILSQYAYLVTPMFPEGTAYREYMVIFGQLAFQGTIAAVFKPRKAWDYLGNLMTILLGGTLLLVPMLLLSRWVTLSQQTYIGYLLMVAILMLLEHIRRSQLLHIGWLLTITWILYRIGALFLIFYSPE